nr:CBASS cGAMP-activated phospholipase [uncultured Carboxylicivirga sp.]
MSEKIFKILTIDGGGIKGLYSSKIIEHFEENFDCQMSDYFDMICGTSTGGILALGLSLKLKASEISNLYEEKGISIFPSQNPKKALLKQLLGGGKYDDKNLRKALEDTFGDKKIEDCDNLLCIPSYSYTDARPWVFKKDHKEGKLTRDNKAYCVDVALATAAAPTYLPLAEIDYYDSKQFVDGGIWANNPSMVGFIEAITYFVGEGKDYDSLKIMSISSLTSSSGKKTGLKRQRSFRHWKSDLFDIMMTGQAKFNEYFMSQIHHFNNVPITFVRVPSEVLSPEQQSIIEMDNAEKDAINLLKGKGNDMGEIWRKKPEIAQFFEDKKTYKF